MARFFIEYNMSNLPPTHQLSSNLTLPFKLVFPTAWLAFFGTITAYILFSEDGAYIIAGGLFSPDKLRIGSIIFMLLGFAMLYLFFIRLQRIDADTDFIYVNNYFRTRRYPYHNIEKITEHRYFLSKIGNIYLKEAGHFGKRIPFMISRRRYKEFLEARPDIAALRK